MNDTGRGGTQGAGDAILRVYLDLSRRIVIVVSCGMFALMVAINGLEIAGRAFFSVSFSWVQEVSILAAMWVYFFAYALIAKNEEYIRVDFAAKLMPQAWQHTVDIFARLVTIFFQGMVAWFALETYRFLGMFTTSVLIWPESLFVLPILIGALDILITELIYLYWVLMRRPLPAPRAMPAAVE
jgi:TRAP-type C4-dicarboxylate transport system permease small subunit